ncbi:ureidoglycolate lyase [Paracoccus aurantiacus]|uniref:Ureidoglycolate lyase n=1 Tax=Paracoccus aurantiacus TaxID=2599412 RepID=A0A5C6S6P3_9RHOB|nr:ureidoglycolate lyase [Paracoccus aurantiacus]TXB69304.1 ureidoglycolate lyase [Paracoccus aurantiacus]
MSQSIRIQTLTAEAFADFGDVLETAGQPDRLLNDGMCGRYHDRASLDFTEGRAGISLFKAKPRALPLKLEMVERHPHGSQAFVPMSEAGFLVVVAPDEDGRPGQPQAFLTQPGQGVNYHRGVWHGALAPLSDPGLFAVVDRIGAGANLEEHWFDREILIVEA